MTSHFACSNRAAPSRENAPRQDSSQRGRAGMSHFSNLPGASPDGWAARGGGTLAGSASAAPAWPDVLGRRRRHDAGRFNKGGGCCSGACKKLPARSHQFVVIVVLVGGQFGRPALDVVRRRRQTDAMAKVNRTSSSSSSSSSLGCRRGRRCRCPAGLHHEP
jgi:hypothetical protein